MNEKGTKKQGNPINQVHHKLRLANTVNNDETETDYSNQSECEKDTCSRLQARENVRG